MSTWWELGVDGGLLMLVAALGVLNVFILNELALLASDRTNPYDFCDGTVLYMHI